MCRYGSLPELAEEQYIGSIFALLYVVVPHFYAFYFFTDIILILLLATAWLIVAVEVVKRRG